MTTPQAGIFAEGHRSQNALEFSLRDGADADAVCQALSTCRKGIEAAGVAHVIAFSPRLWSMIAKTPMPESFQPFSAVAGPEKQAPATQADVVLWLHGDGRDRVVDGVMAACRALEAVCKLDRDVAGFTYHDSRDLTGFVDGSANEDGDDRYPVALIADGQPGAGGSFVLAQKWRHFLKAFDTLDMSEQEKVIGRTKPDSIEFDDDQMPANAHVGRTDIKLDGVTQKLYRRSFPHATATEQGLYFIAFTCDQSRYDAILRNMFGLGEDGVTDRLLEFSTPLTGSYAFAPSEDDLAQALG